MKLLVDTNVLSELERPAGDARARAAMSNLNEAEFFVSVITLGEIAKGVELMARGRRRSALERWLHTLRGAFGARVLGVDFRIAQDWGALAARAARKGRSIQMADGLIAATARIHDLRVATRNVGHILAAGASVYNPWTGEMHEPTP